DLAEFTDLPIIITAKDAVKIRELAKRSPHTIFKNIWVLPVQAVLSDGVYEQMNKVLRELGID
ncbi:MAG: tetraacyldisaccharide 4'-kinase, partial [Moraxella sp.]|nr:tetraacyldisaccharide 4'-kinase [Moraxella sp.]